MAASLQVKLAVDVSEGKPPVTPLFRGAGGRGGLFLKVALLRKNHPNQHPLQKGSIEDGP